VRVEPLAALPSATEDAAQRHSRQVAPGRSITPSSGCSLQTIAATTTAAPSRSQHSCLVNATTSAKMLGQCDHKGEWEESSVGAHNRFLMVYAPIGGTSRCPAVCTVQSETSLLHCDRSMMHIGTGQQTTACDSSTASSIYVDTYTYQLQYNFNLCMHAGPS
jgi:hypothetical protein